MLALLLCCLCDDQIFKQLFEILIAYIDTQYCTELQEAQKPVEIDKLFEPVNDAFRRHVHTLENQLTAAGIVQTLQTSSQEIQTPLLQEQEPAMDEEFEMDFE